ncbi:methyl-accepting chemotaxis protein [Bacillus sp. Marseille-P3661]|uniref:methyl-accepting chemotaxis protein n=1 Tax=Bacillus sp. Marseille-P3661 TaxID=1936234 RepID=UPI000C82E7D6|nr:methyl-accepting chemotaxis protein [Bacillus sp. Marseille-P3661]
MFNRIHSIDQVTALIPILKEAIPVDISVAICDLEKFVAYFPGENINLNIKVGQYLNPEEPLAVALRQNKRLKADVPAEFYGFEFTGTAQPLHNEVGQVIGGIAVQIRRQSELIAIAEQLTQSLVQANEQISSVANGSNSLADFSQELLGQSHKAGEEVKNTDDVLSMIKRVADQTNLLGLNAAIEAARAGEKGRGFEVVANEIRKFSKETVVSTQKIRETMDRIQQVTKNMGTSIEQIADVGHEQAAAIQQISSFIEDIKELSQKLNEYATKL